MRVPIGVSPGYEDFRESYKLLGRSPTLIDSGPCHADALRSVADLAFVPLGMKAGR